MKELIGNILKEYLALYPAEAERQKQFEDFLKKSNSTQIKDWNNFEGHIVTGAIVYAKKNRKFLLLYHKDLKMYLYPGGHVDFLDNNPLEGALREVKEETGLEKFKICSITKNKLVPLDIDTQLIGYNERLDLPSHYHYDFRYLFIIEKIQEVKVDDSELGDYKWISYEEFIKMERYAMIKEKIIKIMGDNI